MEWQSQLMKAEIAVSRCKLTTSNLVELINDTLYLSNMISQCTPGKLLSAKTLEQSCYQELEKNGRLIAGINSLTWDTYWLFLVKPYSQWMTLRCSITSTQKMVPALTYAIFDGQLKSTIDQPMQLKPMTNIYDLKDRMQRSQSLNFIFILVQTNRLLLFDINLIRDFQKKPKFTPSINTVHMKLNKNLIVCSSRDLKEL